MMTILVLNKNVQLKFFYMGEYPSPDKKFSDNYLSLYYPPHMSEQPTISLKEIHHDFCFICR